MVNRILLSGSVLLLSFGSLIYPLGAQAALAAEKGPLVQSDLIQVAADQQTYEGISGKTFLKGNVNVAYKNVKIRGSEGTIDMGPGGDPEVASFFKRPMAKRIEPKVGEDQMQADVIRIHIREDAMSGEGNVVTHVTTVASDPFLIRSDVQQFDNTTKSVLAKGQVFVDYKGTKTYSPRAILQVGSNGKAEKAVFSGGAKLEQDNSVINGDKITVMVASGNLTAEHNVKTQVKMKDEKSQGTVQLYIASDYQQYDKASDLVLASGNVHILYDGYEAIGPKATFRLKNGQVDQIFLTGRSSIIENDRKIVADKITIVTNPRHFDAVGNVKTQFKSTQQAGATAEVAPTAVAGSKGAKKPGGAKALPPARKPASKKLVPEQDLLDE